ncbi:group 1 glycosyl transferase [Halococcus thailandensis JCM 13552]|uniref:Group 1 glycosyl transferase n=2 Tax=Halococcus thailandensis TaxID=335952 RepID=M0NE57_9EURY|nr:group 1 glycosyl transferase [Halococcus thailandensis JCM 13552]
MWNEFQDRAHNKSKLRRWIYSNRRETVRDFVFSLADGVIPVTDFVVTQMLYETDVSRDKVKAINNTVDVDRFEATTPGGFKEYHNIAKEDKILLTVTNFNYTRKYEAIEYFAPAINSILRDHENWHFVVVGRGEDFATTRKSILDEFDDEVSDRVLFTGYCSDIEKAFVDASICTHLSFRDSAAMTVTEAQAAGKPVVVNTAGGMRDLLDSISDSPPMIISERDELEHTLSELIESTKKRHCIGDHNKEYIQSKFSSELLGKEFEEAIEKFVT